MADFAKKSQGEVWAGVFSIGGIGYNLGRDVPAQKVREGYLGNFSTQGGILAIPLPLHIHNSIQ